MEEVMVQIKVEYIMVALVLPPVEGEEQTGCGMRGWDVPEGKWYWDLICSGLSWSLLYSAP